jgi:hypothetical protein
MKSFGADKGSFANMPKDVKMENYPKNPSYLRDGNLDDSMSKVDNANSMTKNRLNAKRPKSMY